MASTVTPIRGSGARSSGGPSQAEQFVQSEIYRARQRVRLSELGRAGLVCLLVIAGYSVILAYLDRWFEFSSFTRQLLFAVCSIALSIYIAYAVVWPLGRRVNPYYAARLVEQNLDADKNSLVNWLDLHEEPLVPAFHTAITNQAARDLDKVDLEQAIANKPNVYVLGAGGVLMVLLLFLFAASPRQFLSLMKRAWAPFSEATIATRTRLTLIEPPEGDLTVAIGKAVTIEVQVDGRIPDQHKADSLRVLHRVGPADPFETRLLDPTDDVRRWRTTFLATEVKNGFNYKVAGGDAATPEYRVTVRSNPLLTGIDALYHYRPYLRWPDRTAQDPNLKDLRGTEVTLIAHTNRQVREGRLVIEGQKPIQGEVNRDDQEAIRFRLTLDRDTQYRVFFTSAEGETNRDPIAYTIQVLADQAPVVVLTSPGRDVELGVNEVLPLEGQASDDLGLAALTLRLRKEDGKLLEPLPYRGGKPLVRGDGRPPQMLEYKEHVDLAKLREAGGAAYTPQLGQMLEYWLEAADFCDYPAPNVGSSKHYKVVFRAPVEPQKQKNQQDKAAQDQQTHEKQQDQKLQQQNDQGGDGQPSGDTKPGEQAGQQANNKENQAGEQKQGKADSSGEQKDQAGQGGEKEKGQGAKSGADKKAGEQQQDQGGETGDRQADKNEKANGQQHDKPEKSDGRQTDKGGEGAGQQQDKPNQSGEQKAGQGSQSGNAQKSDGSQGNDQKQEQSGQAPNQQQDGRGETGNQHTSKNDKQKLDQQLKKLQEALDKTQKNIDRNNQNSEQKSAAGEEKHDQGEKTGEQNRETKQDQSNNPAKQNGSTGGANAEKKQPEEKAGGEKSTNSSQPNKESGTKDQASAKDSSSGGQKQNDKGDPAKAGDSAGANKESGNNPTDKHDKNEKGAQGSQPKKDGTEPKTGDGPNRDKGGSKSGNANENEKSKAGEQGSKDPGAKDAATSDQKTDKGTQAGEGSERKAADPKQEATGAERQKADGASRPEGAGKTSNDKTGDQSKPNPAQGATQERGNGNSEKTAQNQDKIGQEKSDKSLDGRTEQGKNPETGREKNSQQSTQDKSDKSSDGRKEQGKDPEQGGEKNGQQSTQDKTVKPDAKQAREALEKLQKDLQSSDPKTRQEAEKKLEEIRKLAQDPEVRKAAEAMQKAAEKEKQGNKSGDQTSKDQNSRSANGQSGKSKDEKAGTQEKPSSQGKPGDSRADEKNEHDKQKSPEGQNPQQTGNGAGANKEPGKRGDREQAPNNGALKNGEGNRPDPPPGDRDTTDSKRFQKLAGDLTLEKLKKNVNDDVLKEAKMSKEEYDQFLKAYKNMLENERKNVAEKEKLPAPMRGGAAQPNRGLRQIEAIADPKFSAERSGPALAPSEFRDAYNKFSKGLAELPGKGDRK
jgi:hypothetical protein